MRKAYHTITVGNTTLPVIEDKDTGKFYMTDLDDHESIGVDFSYSYESIKKCEETLTNHLESLLF